MKTVTFADLQEAINNKGGSDLDCLLAPDNGDPANAVVCGISCFLPDIYGQNRKRGLPFSRDLCYADICISSIMPEGAKGGGKA